MDHPNAHASAPGRFTRLPGLAYRSRRRTALVITGCVIVSLVATTVLAYVRNADALRPPDPAARQITALNPHIVVFSVPTKTGKGGSKKKHHSDDSDNGSDGSDGSASSSGSGDATVSNTVDGTEVGGARTYNNHTVSPDSSSSSGSDGSSSGDPVQLKDNTGAGAASLDPRGHASSSANAGGNGSISGVSSSTDGGSTGTQSSALAVMLMRVSCPSSIAAGTVCLQVTSAGGRAASLPANTPTASLPLNTSTSNLSTGAPTSALGQPLGGTRPDLSALESQSGKKIELTGYSFQDNQGGNNATISCPQIHQQAGGIGTYQDPITVASGGKSGGASADGVKCGDRFYIPAVQRYVIVEDTGNTPNKSMPHLDMYVADDPNKSCMNKISGTVTAIEHPPPGLPVLAGPIGNHGSCKLPGSGGSS